MKHSFNFLIYPDVQPMDLIGPWEVIATWQSLFPKDVAMQIVGEKKGLVKCLNGITLSCDTDFTHAPQAKYLVIPGGYGRIKEMENPALIEFIQQQAKQCDYIIAVCTGTFLLAKAGLIDDKTVTTYWRALPELAQYKTVKICEQRIVKAGNFWFSGGISSGIDLAFALIDHIAGKKVAGEVQLAFEYFPEDTVYATRGEAEQLPTYPTLTDDTPIWLPEYIAKKLKA